MRARPTRAQALAFGALLPLAPRLTASGEERPKLIVAGPPTDDIKNVFYGIRSGIFRKYGVDVEMQIMGSGAAAMAAVVGGAVHFAFAAVVTLLQGVVRGVPFRIVAPGQLYLSSAPTTALFVRSDSPIRSARDLNGKIVSIQSAKDLNWAATVAWMDQNGGDSQSVKLLELPFPAVLPAIDAGRIDAGMIPEPFMEQGRDSGKVRMLGKPLDAIGKRFLFGTYVSTVDAIAANPEAFRAFARGMHDAALYTNSHQAQTVPIVAEYSHIDPALVAKSVRAVDPEYIEPSELQPVIDISVRYKLIDKPVVAADLISDVSLRRPPHV